MSDILSEIFATPDERAMLAELDLTQLPTHIAVIMDGNGRWATRQGLPRVLGHHAGVDGVRALVQACKALGIAYLTLYSFSTENWTRPESEVGALMELIEHQMRTEAEGLHREGIRIRQLGRRNGLPTSLQQTLADVEALTDGNTRLTLQFAINYSGRTELLDAVRQLAMAACAGDVDPATLSEDDIAGALYAPDIPDPDLLIRTAGEQRVSNYLLWQIAYSEFWFTPVLWPEFRGMHLLQALTAYQGRLRKFGGVTT